MIRGQTFEALKSVSANNAIKAAPISAKPPAAKVALLSILSSPRTGIALNRMMGEAGSCEAGVKEVLMTWVHTTGAGKVRREADNNSGGAGGKKTCVREGRSRGVSVRMTEQHSALGGARGGGAAGGAVLCSPRAGVTRASPVVGAATAGARCAMVEARDAMAGNVRGSI